MLNKMLNLAQYELMNYPHKNAGYYLSYPFKALAGRNDDPNDRMGYPNGLLAKAMMDFYRAHTNTEEAREITDLIKRYFGRWAFGGRKLYSLEDAYVGMTLIDIHQITGDERYKEGVDKIYHYIIEHETDDAGSLIPDPLARDKYIYVNTIGTVCPFLAKYSSVYGDMGAMNMAIVQIENYLASGMDEKTQLPYHGYNSETGMKMGIIGWGQAVGKLLMGMSETLFYMDPTSPSYENIRQCYRRIVDKVETYQAEGGLYHWQLSAKEGPADTAATAMILSAVAQSLEDKVLIGIHKSRMMRGVEALKACIQEDGSLPGAEADAEGFSMYPLKFDSYPWGLGPALSLFVATEEPV